MAGHNKESSSERTLATNPIAYSNYSIGETLEAGIALTGTEIKSMRATSPNIRDAYVEIRQLRAGALEAWLLNAHIGHYSHGNIWNHELTRRRKLLLHAAQIARLYGEMTQKGMTVIPTKIYLVKGKAKVELGVGKGKKKHDKRESLKKKAAQLEMDAVNKYKERGE
jgi:SsrA-binding protein